MNLLIGLKSALHLGRGEGRRYLTAIVLLATAIRITAAVLLPDQNFPDAGGYRDIGALLWSAGIFGSSTVMPLYPALVGLTGPGLGQLAMDITLSAVAVWLVYELANEIYVDEAAALLAALMVAIYPYFIFYAVVGLTESLFIALLLATFLCWYRGQFFAASLLVVLSILTRPAIEPLAPILILYFAVVIHRLHVLKALRHLAVFAATYVVLMSPWWVHNYRTYGQFVHLNLASGFVLYSGNNPLNKSGGGISGQDFDESAFVSIKDPVERDKAFKSAAIGYIKENPAHFLKMAGVKFLRFWRLWPYVESYASPLYIVVSLISFGPVLLLALFYLFLWGWRERVRILPVAMWLGFLSLVHMVLIGSVRYRLPLEPFLIIFAAVATTRSVRWISEQDSAPAK